MPQQNCRPLTTAAREKEFFIDNLLVPIHFIIAMIRWTGRAPREFEFPVPGSLISSLMALEEAEMDRASHLLPQENCRPLTTAEPGRGRGRGVARERERERVREWAREWASESKRKSESGGESECESESE